MHVLGLNFYYLHLLILVIFITIYWLMGMKKHFGADETFTNAAYYGTVTHATVGFGDITPKTPVAKWVTTAHIALVFLAMTTLVITD